MLAVPTLLLALCTGIALANPVYLDLVEHEKLTYVPTGFSVSKRAASDDTVNLRLSLAQGDVAGLEKKLFDVSSPDSQNYGRHLTRDELTAYVKPSADTTSKVNDWLSSHGVQPRTISSAGDWVEISVPVSKANEMLAADYQVYTHHESGRQTKRTLSYSVPAMLKEHLNAIHPTVNFPIFTSLQTGSDVSLASSGTTAAQISPSPSCQEAITPECIIDLYNIPKTPATQPSNNLYVPAFIGQYANIAHLQEFIKEYRPDMSPNANFSFESVDGGQNLQDPNQAGTEAGLDIQYTVGLATGVPVTFLAVGPVNYTSNEDFFTALLDEADYLLAMDQPPKVLSTSYGVNEKNLTQSVAVAICNKYMQLGARGTTVIFGSGDAGIAGAIQPEECDGKPFIPTFPGTCPYVTSVGGTILRGETEEWAWNMSSGGFSNYFPRPSYQEEAVSAYTQYLGSTYEGRYNSSGRGIPDVAALAVNFTIIWSEPDKLINGTSASGPVFASIVALLNDQLISAGKAPLGFLNPILYSQKGREAFKDIVSGSNPGCGTEGFPAITGWDPITGFGTPIFDKLRLAVGL